MADFSTNDGVPLSPPVVEPQPHRLYSVESDTYLGCPVLSKTHVVSIPRGVQAILEWTLRNKAGDPINIGDVVDNGNPTPDGSGQIIFRFFDAIGCCLAGHQIIGYGADVENGVVRVELTEAIAEVAGIYRFEIGITDSDGVLQLTNTGLLSIERGFYSSITEYQNFTGPLTLSEVRLYLRDSVVENDLHDEFEFDDAEIIHAMSRPIMEWNETPPDVACFNGSNFPWRHHWLLATTAQLLKIAAHWYRRNKLQATHGGLAVDDKNKDREYLAVAKDLDMEWKEFVNRKKIEINIGLASGSVGSPYGGGW